MNAKSVIARNYEEKRRFWLEKNKANSNPNASLKARSTEYDYAKQSQFPKKANECKLNINKGLCK